MARTLRIPAIWRRISAAITIVAGTTASGGSIGVGSAGAVHLRAPLSIDLEPRSIR